MNTTEFQQLQNDDNFQAILAVYDRTLNSMAGDPDNAVGAARFQTKQFLIQTCKTDEKTADTWVANTEEYRKAAQQQAENTVDLNAGAPVSPEPATDVRGTAQEAMLPQGEPVIPTPNFRDIAMAAVARGETRILPILVGGKNPIIKWAHLQIHDVSPAEWQTQYTKWIEELAAAYPNANACTVARADEHLYIDEDKSDEFRKGFEAFAGEPFPRTHTTSARPNRRQSGWKQTEYSRKMLWNIVQGKTKDQMFSIRFHNLYVLAEGSVHPKGTTYTAVDDSPLMPIPDALVDYILSLVVNVTFERGQRVELNEDGTQKEGGNWFESFSLDEPFVHGNIDNTVKDFIWYYIKHQNVNDGQQLFEAIANKFETNGCLEPDGITPFNWNHEQIRKKCFDKVKTITTGEQDRQAATEEALSKAANVGKQAADAFAAIPKEQIVTTPQQFPAAQELAFKYPAVHGSHRDYVVSPLLGQQDGWFPLGDPSVVGGASGSGKTTEVLDILEKQARKESVHGHQTFGLSYLVLMYDRGRNAFKRTMERMGFGENEIPTKRLPSVVGADAIRAIIDKIEEGGPDKVPQIVFIEGADMLVENAGDARFVVPFLSGIQRIAEHYHIAMILSVGAPKVKVGEGYVAKRDSIFGSEKWSRMTETVMVLQYFEGDDTGDKRVCFCLLRNGAAERFNLVFQDGRLVIGDPEQFKTAMSLRPTDQLGEAKQWYIALFTDSTGQFKKEVTLDEHRKAEQNTTAFSDSTLKRARRFLGIEYKQKKRVYRFITPPAVVSLGASVQGVEPSQEPSQTSETETPEETSAAA